MREDATTARPARQAGPEPLPAVGIPPFHILRPAKPNRTWHLDLTVIRVLWLRVHVLAVLDGFSRKLLTLTPSLTAPRTRDILTALRAAMKEHGRPRFLVTDHGGQFLARFEKGLPRGTAPVKGRVRSCAFNGKVERFFRTLKLWQRVALIFASLADLRCALDAFRSWYNSERVHQGVNGLTPDEAWCGESRPAPVRYLARHGLQPVFEVRRRDHMNDPDLPVFDIRLAPMAKRSA